MMTECSDTLNKQPDCKCSGTQVRDRYFTYKLWAAISGSEWPREKCTASRWETQKPELCSRFDITALSAAAGVIRAAPALSSAVKAGVVVASAVAVPSEKVQCSLVGDWKVTFFSYTQNKKQLQPFKDEKNK